MAPVVNRFEAANGVVLSSANVTGFVLVGGTAPTLSTDWADEGLTSAKFSAAAGLTSTVRIGLDDQTTKLATLEAAFLFPPPPPALGVEIFATLRYATGSAARLAHLSDGRIQVQGTSPYPVCWTSSGSYQGAYRVLLYVRADTATTGSGFVAIYLPDSTTPMESGTISGANFNTLPLVAAELGRLVSPAWSALYYADSVQVAGNRNAGFGPVGRGTVVDPLGMGVIGDSMTWQNGAGPTDIPAAQALVGWVNSEVHVDAVVGRSINGTAVLPSAPQAIASMRATGFDPQTWMIQLGGNGIHSDLAAQTGYITSLLDTIVQGTTGVYRVYWPCVIREDPADPEITRFMQALNDVRAVRADCEFIPFDLQTMIHNGRDETGFWDPASPPHMLPAGYAIRHQVIAGQSGSTGGGGSAMGAVTWAASPVFGAAPLLGRQPVMTRSIIIGNVPALAGQALTATITDRLGATDSLTAAVTTSTGSGLTGSLMPGETAYPIPSTGVVKYVNPDTGVDSGAGGIGAPYKTAQFAINNAGVGGTVILRGSPTCSGIYHEGAVPGAPADTGVSFGAGRENAVMQSYPNEVVWFDGSVTVTGWALDTTTKAGTNLWKVPWTVPMDRSVQFAQGSDDTNIVGYTWLDASDPQGAIANFYDQVFMITAGGVKTVLVQVASTAALGAGKFYVAGSLKGGAGSDKNLFTPTTLYIGSDPAGQTVRVSDKSRAISLIADGATIRGFGVRRYAPANWNAAAVSFNRTGTKMENIYIEDIAAVGVSGYLNKRLGPITMNRVTMRYCGLNGFHGNQADDIIMTGCLVEFNNSSHWMMAPAAGGVKITATVNVTATDCIFRDNWADGFWVDASVYNTNVISCDALDNDGHGIEIEISAKGIIADCVAGRNGKDGILIRCSDAIRVWNNTTFSNGEVNLDATQDNRRIDTGVFGQDSRHPSGTDPVYGTVGMTWIIENIDFFNNVTAKGNTGATGGLLRIRSQESPSKSYTLMGCAVDGNFYGRTVAGSPSILIALASASSGAVGYTTLASAKSATAAAGVALDVHSVLYEGADPLTATYTLTAPALAAAAGAARPLPADIATLVGKATGTAFMGAWR
jgi:parallel beta-helix repeat protein